MLTVHQVFNGLLLIAFCVLATFGLVRLPVALTNWLAARQGRTFARSPTIDVPETSPKAFYQEPPPIRALPGFEPAPPTADELEQRGPHWAALQVRDALLADGRFAVNRNDDLFLLVGDEWVRVTRESLLDAYDAAWAVCGLADNARPAAITTLSILTWGVPVLWAVRNAVLWADLQNGRLRAFPCKWFYRQGLNPAPREIDLSDVDAAGNYQPAVHRDDQNDRELGVVRALLFNVTHWSPANPADRHDVRYNRFREAAHVAYEARALRQAADVQPDPVADQPASAPTRKRL
ncbi:hypothetical protein KDX26_19240 [Burkholderia cenocepacia]|uniref:hypothetical protein n=1 Tax=Burkholderia cenocepacia TaxID=95486 RepID=UPI001BA10BA1|nr:hypothetical protein [Burkholderia cenocepacia]MBR8384534.1 hypothetical protein [Burkholderia cenocepacia]